MIEINALKEDCVAARFRGAVTNAEFSEFAVRIGCFGSTRMVSIYLDWIRIDQWRFAPPQANGVAAWRTAARMIERVAIIHDHRLNRQAAWLAAVLRGEGVTVRSWKPRNARVARMWLGGGQRQLY